MTKSTIHIFVMGATGSGKSSFINLACGSDAVTASDDIESCTETVEEAPPFVLDGQQVKLFDTPSFDHTNRSPHEILQIISEALENQYRKGTKLHGIIFMHPIDAIRINSLAKENFSVFTRLCGTTALKNVVIVANKWPKAQNRRDKFEHRLERLSSSDELFAFAVSNGAHIQKHLEQTAGSAHAIIREMLKNQPIPLAIQEEMVDHHKSIDETTAGIKLNEKSADTMKQLEEKIKLQLKDDEAARRRALEDELSAKIQAYEDKNKKLQDMIAKKKAKIVALQKELEAEINARQESDTDEQADTQPTMYHSIVSGGNHTMQITSGHSFYAAPNLTNKLVEGTPLRTHKWILDKVGDYWSIKSADDDRLYMGLDKSNHLQLLTAIHYWDIRKVPGQDTFRIYSSGRNDCVLRLHGKHGHYTHHIGKDDIWKIKCTDTV